MEKKEIHPPSWADKFLSWYCKPALLEDLQGDLNEYFQRNVNAKGARRARLIYIIDVFKFLRLYTIRKPEFINLLINWIMLGSYVKTSGRSLMRNKLFSAINIVGLSVSMSVGLLMIGVISDIFSYDKFHVNHNRIYRVTSLYDFLNNHNSNWNASNSMTVGRDIQENFPEIEKAAVLHNGFGGVVQFNETMIPLDGLWANDAMFEVFSFTLLQGNAATALKEPFSIVLTETSAKKIFGTESAFGKTVILDKDRQYTVTGIIQDPPVFSHLKFEMLGSIGTREILKSDDVEWKWDNIWSTYVYVLLRKDADLTALQTKLDAYAKKHDNEIPNTKVFLSLQPIGDILVGEDHNNQISPTLGNTTLWIFIAIAAVVLLSACFNYTNLSIARALRRSREVGVRKIVGAVKSHIISQFVVEAIMISLIALIIALGLFVLLRPHLLNLQSDLKKLLVLDLSPALVGYFIGFAILIGIFAGIFPALFFSKINTVKVIKDLSTVHVFRKLTMRKVLIVFQYCVSIIFITSTFIIFKQYKHFMSYDMGFNAENIVNIRLQDNKAEVLKQELSALPEVKAVSQSRVIAGTGNYWGVYLKNPKDPADSAMVWYNFIDENYLPLHEFQLMAGRNFAAKPDSAKEDEVIVNQAILKRYNIANQVPSEAIGEVIEYDHKKVTIIGVIHDYVYGKADNSNSTEVLLRYGRHDGYLNVKIMSNDKQAVQEKLEAIWKKHDPVHPFEAKLYTDRLKEGFEGLSASIKLAGFMAALAICIASLGLLGMVIFTTETRLREISIRKVLGASEGKLIVLLGKSFFILLAVAAGIALPITYLFFDQILLVEMGNHTSIAPFEMFIGVFGIMVIAAIMVGSQTFKVARSNPAEVLKNE
jgi:putative ABC transport system permease protein